MNRLEQTYRSLPVIAVDETLLLFFWDLVLFYSMDNVDTEFANWYAKAEMPIDASLICIPVYANGHAKL